MMQNWKTYCWGEISELKYGKGLKNYRDLVGDIPVYGTNGYIGQTDTPLCNKEGIIVGRKGAYRGIHFSPGPFFVIDTAFFLVPKIESLDIKFCYYQLLTQDINGLDSGSAIPSTSRDDFYKLKLELPPLQEQKAIASILSALDDKIELNLQMNKTLEEMATALYKHWFVDFGPFKEGRFVESELGMIPEGWSTKILGEASILSAGGDKPKSYSKDATEVNKVPIYSNGINDDGLYGYTDNPKINIESVTISARGTIGFVCLRPHPYFPIVRLISAIPIQELISSKYLYLYLKNQNISGTGTTQQQLTVPDFSRSPIIIPSTHVVKNFSQIVDSFYTAIDSNKSENQTLTTLRNTLLPKLISGEVRVKDIEQMVAAAL